MIKTAALAGEEIIMLFPPTLPQHELCHPHSYILHKDLQLHVPIVTKLLLENQFKSWFSTLKRESLILKNIFTPHGCRAALLESQHPQSGSTDSHHQSHQFSDECNQSHELMQLESDWLKNVHAKVWLGRGYICVCATMNMQPEPLNM